MKRAYLTTAAAVLTLLLGGWFLLVQPKVSATHEAHRQARAAQDEARRLGLSLSVLQGEVPGLAAQQQRLRAYEQKVPPTTDLPALIRSLSALAAADGVQIVALAPATPVPPHPTGRPAPSAGTSSGAPSDSPLPGTPLPSTPAPGTAVPSTSATASPAISGIARGSGSTAAEQPPTTSGAAPTPAPPAGGPTPAYSVVPLTLTVTGSYFAVENFLTGLETLPRALVVTSVDLAPEPPATSPPAGPSAAPTATPTAAPTGSPSTSAAVPPTTGPTFPAPAASATADGAGSAPTLRAVLHGEVFTAPAPVSADMTAPPLPAPSPSPSSSGLRTPMPTGSAPRRVPVPAGPPSGAAALGGSSAASGAQPAPARTRSPR